MADKDLLADAREAFEIASEAEADNRDAYIDDIEFARLGKQWPEKVVKEREREGRPCLTINHMPSFIRQVVNDARQNKPSIKVHPVDSSADPETAKIYDGLIRNIEYTSSADIAYDTAIESAVSGGFGYWRIKIDYSCDDTFDKDLTIDRVADPLLIYGDPESSAADSSDWNSAFIIEKLSEDEFTAKYPKAEKSNFAEDYGRLGAPWYDNKVIMTGEWWRREKVMRDIILMSDGSVLDADGLEEIKDFLAAQGITVVKSRPAEHYKVTQTILSGAEVLQETVTWAGKYIPIVPVYGDEIWLDGVRHLHSLVRHAKDSQRMFNYWRTTTTELAALAPKTPFIGPKGAFKTDIAKWETANTQNHPYIEYDPQAGGAPQRQPFAGVPAGAMQEALAASDDMKAILGIYDASLGQRSNETSGIAITARQREGDVSTFHFIDNMARSIRHTGRILLDLIPHVYSERKMLRILGEDNKPSQVPLGQPVQMMGPEGQPQMGQNGLPATKIFDLGAGKYDLTVQTGPSFTTRRQEAAAQMTDLVKAFPAAAPAVAGPLARNLDWPGADELAERFDSIWNATKPPAPGQGGLPPQVQQLIQQGQQEISALNAKVQQLEADKSIDMAKVGVDQQKLKVEAYKAETDRMHADLERVNGAAAQEQRESGREQAHHKTMEQLAGAIGALAQAHAAPKRIVRGPDGRALGTEIVQPQTMN